MPDKSSPYGAFFVILVSIISSCVAAAVICIAMSKHAGIHVATPTGGLDRGELEKVIGPEISKAVAGGLENNMIADIRKILSDYSDKMSKGAPAASAVRIDTSAVIRDAQAAAKSGDADIASLLYTKAIMLDPDDMKAVDEYVAHALKTAKETDSDGAADILEQAAGVLQSAIMRGKQSNFTHLRDALNKLNIYFDSRSANAVPAASVSDVLSEYRKTVDAVDADDVTRASENASTLETVVNELGSGLYSDSSAAKIQSDAQTKLERVVSNMMFDKAIASARESLKAYDAEKKPEYASVLLGRANATLADIVAVRGIVSPKLADQLDKLFSDVQKRAVALRDKEVSRVKKYNTWAIKVIKDAYTDFDTRRSALGPVDKMRSDPTEDIAVRVLSGTMATIDVVMLDGDVARMYQEVFSKIYENVKTLESKISLAETMFKASKRKIEDM